MENGKEKADSPEVILPIKMQVEKCEDDDGNKNGILKRTVPLLASN